MARLTVRELRTKLSNELEVIENTYEGESPQEIAAQAADWVAQALDLLYSSEKDRLARARQALIKAHGRLEIITAPESED